jgi:uncharacterized repeat protein (TIGR02543 family)
MANTIKIFNQSGNTAVDSAAVFAYEYSSGGKEDWHLPSIDELQKLYDNRNAALTSGFFNDFHWSSSETSAKQARAKHFGNGGTSNRDKNNTTNALWLSYGVRPVRTFAASLPLTVTYDSQSGSAVSAGSTTTGGTLVSLPTTSREGYTFNGWFTAASGGSQVTTSSPHGRTASFTLHAQWTISTYAVSFNGNGSTGGSVPVDQTKTHGIDVSVASNSGSLVKTGYTFGGWNTAGDGSGISYAEGASYEVDEAVTLYAKWTANSLTVTYDSQGGSSVSDGSTTSGGVIASAPVAPTRTGYVFTGWFAASTGGSAISFPYTHGRTADFTLYAQWSVNTYVVSFDGNGPTGGSVPANQTKTHGIDIAVASNSGSLVKTGYTFGGWNTHADGSGTSFLEGATYGVDGSLSLLAVWVGDALTVTYDSDPGSAVSDGSTTSGGVIASAPVAPTRTGYVFTGWFAASTGGSAITFPHTHGQSASFTLYARWSQASLHGIGSVSKIGTITTTANVGNTFAVDTESSSVSLRYPANGLPANTVIDVYLVNDLSRARSLVAPAGGFVVSLVVAWLAADGSVPLMASGKPLSMTIANDTIKAGAKTYAIVGGEVTLLGTASVNGSVTISITEDPEIVIVNPVVVSQPSAAQPSSVQPSVSRPASIARGNPVKVVESLPQIPGSTSKIAAILNTVAGKLPPKPTVFAPKIPSNGQIARIAFTPIQIKAPPANAPVAPLGARIFPIGAKIEHSRVTPTAPVSRVAAGESKATFGGQTINTEMSKAANGPAILSAGPATIALAGFADEPAASRDNTGGSTGLTASSSTPLEIATGSFIALTPVQVWLFSTPLLLAETAVDENGNFAAAISLPSSIPAGNHTLQIQGFVYAAGGAAEVTANIGVSIAAAAVGTRWSGTFPMYVASIMPSVKSQWTKFVSAQNSTVFICAVTPVKPERNSKANIRLYENRLIAMTTMLKYNGCASVETLAPSRAKKSSVANRTWTVVVQSQATTVALRWVHDFSTYASTINPAQKATWTALSTDFAGQKIQCVITGSEPIRNSLANARIFANRNENMKAYLLKNGCSEVQINKPISAKTKLASRTKWKVEASLIS